jgi:type I restriction enzyme, S subunit
MNKLPRGWAEATVEAIAASLVDGPFGSNLKTEHYQSSGVRVIRLQNIADGKFDDGDKAYISLAHANSLNRHEARPGDVLIAALGDVLPRACLVPPDINRAIVKADCFRLRPYKGISASYLAYILSAPQIRNRASTEIAGVGRPRLNLRKVSTLAIPVPPSAEQDRIVAAIEEQFSRLDVGVAALERARQNLKRLRDLLPLMLLAGIDFARIEDKPVDDSLRRWVSLAEVSEQVVDCDHSTPKFLLEGMPCIDTTCISPGVIHRDKLRYVDPITYKSRVHRLVPQRGDLVFAREGTVGTAVVVPTDLHPCLGQRVMLFRPDQDKADSDYLCFIINSQVVKRQYRTLLLGTTVPHINVRDAKALRIPLPELAVQRAVVAEADRIGSVLNAVECAVELIAARSSSLRSSVLSAAFSGRLVSQDLDDEAASALLERIAAERAFSNADKSTLALKRRGSQKKVTL